jgi:hypothetical protein
MKIKIRTRWKDIRRGIREDMQSCVLACAIREQTKAEDVRVGGRLHIYGGEFAGTYAMSDRAKRYASKFDRQGRTAIRPQSFIFQKIS